jgi:hypothetical protein
MATINKPLTNLQLELLKLFSMNLPEEELLEIRRMLANYFAERASNEMDRLWEENKWTNETMDDWLRDDSRKTTEE